MGFLTGKKALITGVASKKSIAWGIARAMHREGAELAYTYQGERFKGRVEDFAAETGSDIVLPCDVSSDHEIEAVFQALGERWGSLDILVHSIAYAPREELAGDYLDCVTREGFLQAHEISSYSLAAMARAAKPLLNQGGAIVTLSYIGAVRAMPNYNVMGVAKASLEANVRYLAASLGPHGVRVNAISAGPIRTLAASGISGMRDFLNYVEQNAPLRRNVTIEEVGNTAAFLCSDLASAITGEVTYVDCGFSIVGMAGKGEE